MISHHQAHELLPAFALDAVEDRERHEIETHLMDCPRCTSELDSLRDVAAALGNSVEPVPEGVWSAISTGLVVPDHEATSVPDLTILKQIPTGQEARHPPEKAPRSRRSRRYLMVVTSVAAAAVAATVVLSVSLVRTSDQNDRLQAQFGSNNSSVVAALETPGHSLVSLRDAKHGQLAQFVLLPSGRGYLVSSSLPKLTDDNTYQLWGIFGGQAISLGLLGSSPTQATFTIAGSEVPSQLGVTVEPASGSVIPTTAMLASGATQTS